MKTLIAVLAVPFVVACSTSATVEAPASDGVVAAADADGPPPVVAGDVVVASRPQLPTTISPQPAATEPSYVVKGCASGTRSAAPDTDGDDIKESVNVSANAAGVTVSHKVPHACCLKGAVATSVEGSLVTIREQLTGNPCRCLCGSGIETTVPLSPGDYDVHVLFEQPNSKPREVTTKKVTIKAAH